MLLSLARKVAKAPVLSSFRRVVTAGSMAEIKVSSLQQFLANESKPKSSSVFLVFDDAEVLKAKFASSNIQNILKLSNAGDIEHLSALAGKLSASNDGASSSESSYFTGSDKQLTRVVVILLPSACSRHNSPARPHALAAAVKGKKGSDETTVAIFPRSNDRAFAQICAVSRQYPLFSMKSSEPKANNVHITVDFPEEANSEEIVFHAQATIESIRLSQKLVDSPPNILHSDALVETCRQVAAEVKADIKVIQGRDLEAQGFGGIWGVGKAAEHLPALVILSYIPSASGNNAKSVCMVGKGIIYDTGGLSIKTPTTSMAGMKMDMGGSAAVLGAFAAAVKSGNLQHPLHALLCIAENSVGPLSTRPDDVHTFLSGKTVEVNNTDAEGRLVLSDGCFYAHKFLNAQYIVDIATLTGAQLIATGKNHAAIFCSDETFEDLAVEEGKYSGDLVFPIVYCPEFHRGEFKSAVADMKNSVADRGNAQSSCAGQFIGNHLEEFLKAGGKWLHVDMAGPAMVGDRATGYGVGLLFRIAKRLNASSTL